MTTKDDIIKSLRENNFSLTRANSYLSRLLSALERESEAYRQVAILSVFGNFLKDRVARETYVDEEARRMIEKGEIK